MLNNIYTLLCLTFFRVRVTAEDIMHGTGARSRVAAKEITEGAGAKTNVRQFYKSLQ
jgi:hypothetical protein